MNVTCISHNSMPAAQLAWYINGEKADPVHIKPYPVLTRNKLLTSRLGLSFKVHNQLNLKINYALIASKYIPITQSYDVWLFSGTPQAFPKRRFKAEVYGNYIDRLLEVQ